MSYYLDRYSLRGRLISNDVPNDLGIIIVIPCCNEPNLIASLQSLFDCDLPNCSVEVITIINASEIAPEAIIDQNLPDYDNPNWTALNFVFNEDLYDTIVTCIYYYLDNGLSCLNYICRHF